MSVLRLIRECDMFRKMSSEGAEAEAPEHMPSVGIRVISFVLISILGFYETYNFLTPIRKQKFDLDMGETAGGHDLHNQIHSKFEGLPNLAANSFITMLEPGAPKKMRVLLDMTIHGFPCIDLSLDYQDVMGTRAVDVRTTIFKQRLNKDGSPVDAEHMKNDPKQAQPAGSGVASTLKGNETNSTCGECYGALPPGECCNSCSDVLYAYRLKRWALPRIEEITQCKNDGTAKSAYQPPQIIHLGDYSSEDYLPKFTKLSALSSSPTAPRITTPFRFDSSRDLKQFSPLKPLTSLGSSPFILNFSGRNLEDDSDDDLYDGGFDDWDAEDGKDSSEKTKEYKWPKCVQRNVIIHGYDIGEALMIDLGKHGAKTGCWNDDCRETDKFACDAVETCAEMCRKVDACRWWTWGDEDKTKKCWIRTGRHGREKRYGFSSGPKGCFSSNETSESNATAETAAKNATTEADAKATADTGAKDAKGEVKAEANAIADADAKLDAALGKAKDDKAEVKAETKDAEPVNTQPRRMMSFEDGYGSLSYGGGLGGGLGGGGLGGGFGLGGGAGRPFMSSYMPMFGYGQNSHEDKLRKEQQGESCRVYGYFDTNKVPGNFHIGTHGNMLPSYMTYFDEPKPAEQNMRHVINRLAFVDVISNKTLAEKQPLDGFDSPKAFTFQYYITINPATITEEKGRTQEGYQYRSSSYVTNELIGPAVFFRYDIDPIRVTYYTETVSLTSWLTTMCAVIGGCIAFTTILTQMMEAVFCG